MTQRHSRGSASMRDLTDARLRRLREIARCALGSDDAADQWLADTAVAVGRANGKGVATYAELIDRAKTLWTAERGFELTRAVARKAGAFGEDGPEVAQEALAHILNNVHKFDPPEAESSGARERENTFDGWAYRVARNAVIDVLERYDHRTHEVPWQPSVTATYTDTPETDVLGQIPAEIEQLVRALDPELAPAFWAVALYRDRMTVHAKALGIKTREFRRRYHDIIAAVRAYLESQVE